MVSKGRKQERARAQAKGRTTGPERTSVLLIVRCEGETEVEYLKQYALQVAKLRKTEIDIQKEGVPFTCAEAARDQVRKAKREYGEGNVVAAVVVDRDEHPRVAEARQIAKDHGILYAETNPAIELWFLLHHRDQTAYLDRDQARQFLEELFPEYKKGVLPPLVLEPEAINAAKQRARALETNHREAGSLPNENPSSALPELLEKIDGLAKKATGR